MSERTSECSYDNSRISSSVEEARAILLGLNFQESVKAECSAQALTALVNHSYLVTGPIAYFLDSSATENSKTTELTYFYCTDHAFIRTNC